MTDTDEENFFGIPVPKPVESRPIKLHKSIFTGVTMNVLAETSGPVGGDSSETIIGLYPGPEFNLGATLDEQDKAIDPAVIRISVCGDMELLGLVKTFKELIDFFEPLVREQLHELNRQELIQSAAQRIAKEQLQDLEFLSVAETFDNGEFTEDEMMQIHRLALTAHPTIN